MVRTFNNRRFHYHGYLLAITTPCTMVGNWNTSNHSRKGGQKMSKSIVYAISVLLGTILGIVVERARREIRDDKRTNA